MGSVDVVVLPDVLLSAFILNLAGIVSSQETTLGHGAKSKILSGV